MFPYLKALMKTHPFILKSTISGGLLAFSDLISQKCKIFEMQILRSMNNLIMFAILNFWVSAYSGSGL